MKIGFLSLPLTGHLNPMSALARKLQSRGHEVVFIGVPDIEPVVRAADLDFVPFCENEYPPGSVAKSWSAVANLHGLDVVRYTARELTPGLVKAALEHLPGKIAAGVAVLQGHRGKRNPSSLYAEPRARCWLRSRRCGTLSL